MRHLWRTLRYGHDATRRMEQEERAEALWGGVYDERSILPLDWYVNGHRIPKDVQARAEKAGVTKAPDWYAGR